jgi:hypothetical protein
VLLTVIELKRGDDLFNYTRGRFVYNEAQEMAQRHIRFNVNELARRAAEDIGTRSYTSIEKYPDGMYNKCMLLTMNNGAQVVAKFANPNAGLPHFTTASEVATMDFVCTSTELSQPFPDEIKARNILVTPVPRVLSWNSKVEGNPVGAEYIIMEKVSGVELAQVWPSKDIKA